MLVQWALCCDWPLRQNTLGLSLPGHYSANSGHFYASQSTQIICDSFLKKSTSIHYRKSCHHICFVTLWYFQEHGLFVPNENGYKIWTYVDLIDRITHNLCTNERGCFKCWKYCSHHLWMRRAYQCHVLTEEKRESWAAWRGCIQN